MRLECLSIRARWMTAAVLAAVAVTVSGVRSATAEDRRCPQCREFQYGQPDLFYNYFVNPACGGVGSSLYVAPGPIPQSVGHTYVTYQPLMPHEFMYPHHRTYHKSYDDGKGLSRASVHWYRPPFKQTLSHIHHGIKLAR